MDAWGAVDCPDDMNILEGIWAFKLKRFPDGMIKKFKQDTVLEVISD